MTYSLGDLLVLGGPMMWPLLLCSVLAAAIIGDRCLSLARTQQHTRQLLSEVEGAVKRRKMGEALALCERARGPIAQIVRVALTKHGQPRDQIRQAIEDAGRREIPWLERHLAALGTIANVAPLLGLLGTTLGLVRCFHVMQVKAAALQPVGPADLAQGLWQALLTTSAGLAIAIPAIVTYNYFARRVQRTVWEMERAATDLLRLLGGEETP